MSNETQDQAPDPEAVSAPAAEPVYSGPIGLPIMTTESVDETPPANHTLLRYPVKGKDWDFAPPSSDVQLHIQEHLAAMDLYPGKKNGDWGNLTVYAIQAAVGRLGGVLDRELCVLIQDYAAELGGYDGGHDTAGILTSEVWDAFARGLERSTNNTN